MSTVTVPSIQEWLGAAEKAALELANTTFGFSQCEIIGHESESMDNAVGGYVSLVNDHVQLELSMLAEPKLCRSMAQTLLGTEEISQDDEADSWGEIVNILAGAMKRNLDGPGASIQMGLPCFVRSPVHFQLPYEMASTTFLWEGSKVHLIMIKRDKNGADKK